MFLAIHFAASLTLPSLSFRRARSMMFPPWLHPKHFHAFLAGVHLERLARFAGTGTAPSAIVSCKWYHIAYMA